MALNYELDTRIKNLNEVSSEHLQWFLELNKIMMYPSRSQTPEMPEIPKGYLQLRTDLDEEEGSVDKKILENLDARYDRLIGCVDRLFKTFVKSKEQPEFKEYGEWTLYFELFMDTLTRIEKEYVLDDGGIDPLTGLRNQKVLKTDVDIEMQRLARSGKPFSVGMLRVSEYKKLLAEATQDNKDKEGENNNSMKSRALQGMHKYIAHVSDLIKQSVRSFDDAYYIGGGEFILTLKQADVSGGFRAFERLKELLEDEKYNYEANDLTKKQCSIACCVVEPIIDEDIERLIEGMRDNLWEAETKGRDDILLEYYELSPFQRYIKQSRKA